MSDVTAVFFSPSETTKKVVNQIADNFEEEKVICDLLYFNDEKNFECTVAGRCCESGDILQENVLLPKPERGDILAVLVTGAYNYSMASNYNRIPRPCVVGIANSK